MANVKITELTELAEAPAASDVVPVVDVSASQTKKLTMTNLFSYLTGAISTVLTSNLTVSRAVVSSSSGKLEASAVTSTEVGYLTGQTDYTNTRPVVNLLYNGNFDLWDKGTAPSAGNDNYILPGVLVLAGTGGGSPTCSQQTASLPDGSRYAVRLVGSSHHMGLVLFLEAQDAIALRNKVVSLSVKVKSPDTGIKGMIVSWTSTADSLTSNLVSSWADTNPTLAANWTNEGESSISAGADWQTLKVENITLDASGMNNVAVFIFTTDNPATGTVDFAQVQLEIGSKATGFVPRPVSLEKHLASRRYLRMTGDASGNGPAIAGVATAGSQVFRNFIPFPVEMVRTPTATVGGTWGLVNCTGPTLSKTSVHGSCLTATSSASGVFSAETNSASGDYLEFDGEL